jgi:ferredoxin-nitrate reductase
LPELLGGTPLTREELNDRIADIWGERTPHSPGDEWPERVDTFLRAGMSEADVQRWVPSACVLCSNGCGLDIAVVDGEMVGVRGRASDRVNRGRLGPKGLFGWQGQQHDRLREPMVRTSSGHLVSVDWDTAMDTVVQRSRRLLEERGPLSHAFYTSFKFMLEEY